MVQLLEHKKYFCSCKLTQNMTVDNKFRIRDDCVESRTSSSDLDTPWTSLYMDGTAIFDLPT